MKIALAAVAIALVAAGGSGHQRASSPEFANIKTFRCDFTESEGRRTTANGGTVPAKRETFNDLVVDNVDYQRRTARFIGNAGSETVQVLDGDLIVSFLETSMTGNPALLSILKRTGSLSQYKAVYSRHMALTTGDVALSQSYGICRGLL